MSDAGQGPIIAAADGSSLSNPGPAGWAWYVDHDHWASGGWKVGTNNMGELMAVLDLLDQTAGSSRALHVLCDSQYAINCCTKWIPGWKRRGWRKADGKPVLNVELLKALDEALAGRAVTFEWIKGHSGHALNEAADERARAAATAYRDATAVPTGPGWQATSSSRQQAFAPTPKEEPELDLFSFADEAGTDVAGAGEAGAGEAGAGEAGAGEVNSGGLDADCQTVIDLERELLTTAVRTDPERIAALLHTDFVEHGSSGSILTRNRAVLGLGAIELTPRVEVLGVDRLAPELIALRYRLTLGSRQTLRFSLWQRGHTGWQIRFHQGTITGQ